MTTITEALRAARACIQQDRTSLADTGMRLDNTMEPDAAAGVAEYDAVLQQIDAALAGMTHHITDEQIDATSADELLLKVYELLWGEHPECCGNPEAVGYFGDSPAIDCCRCPNYARLNDAQIVASLRALIKESDLMSLLGMRSAKTTPLADWSVDVFDDDEEGRTYINIRNPDDDVAAAGVNTYVVGNRRTLASQVLRGFHQAFRAALTAAPAPPAQAANIWTDQRARFERWATKDGAWPDNVARSSESPEEYANSYIQDAWLAVQATSPTPAQPEQADPVLVQHRKPIAGKDGETTGYTSWIDGKGLDWWPHRYLYACPTPAQPAVPESADGGQPAQTSCEPRCTTCGATLDKQHHSMCGAVTAAILGLNSARHRLRSGNNAGASEVVERVRAVLSTASPAVPEDVARNASIPLADLRKLVAEHLGGELTGPDVTLVRAVENWHAQRRDAARAAEKGGA